MRLKIKHDLDRILKDYPPQAIQKALPPAVNKTLTSVRSVVVKAIVKETAIKPQKKVGADITIKKARQAEKGGQIGGYIDAKKGRARNLAGFVTPGRRKPSEGPGKPQAFRKKKGRKGSRTYKFAGVTAKAWGRAKVYKSAFIARGGSGNTVVFTRTGSGRDSKLKALHGPSVRNTFIKPAMETIMQNKGRERLPIELQRSLNRAMKGIKK